MARVQQPGVGAITVWMIVFAALWLTSTVFLVILYTGQEELNREIADLTTANSRLIEAEEKDSVELFREARPGGPTVVGLLEEARRELANLATGDDTDDIETVRRKRDQLAEAMVNDRMVPDAAEYAGLSFFDGMTMLYETYKAENALRREAENRVEQLDAEVARLVDLNAEQKNDFDARAAELSDRLAQIEADRTAFRTERNEAVAQLQRQFEEQRAQADADITTERAQSASLKRDLAELRKRFVSQQEKYGELLIGPAELATAREPDGRILTAIPGDEVVYIDLGQEDGLTLGLQFSVYAPETGIPPDGKGKAQLEVASIAPSSAECKILHVESNAVILEGDLIANPIYDPRRPLTFLAIGEFDLDRDGEYDPDGQATVEALITDWGGVVTSELTALTDFVVVGAAPARPRTGREVSPSPGESRGTAQPAWDRYMTTLTSARSLSVPVMSQEVFLNFLGYRGRMARR